MYLQALAKFKTKYFKKTGETFYLEEGFHFRCRILFCSLQFI